VKKEIDIIINNNNNNIIIMFIYPPNNDVIKSITCYKIARTRNWRVVLIHSTRTLSSSVCVTADGSR
jgi:hypothetical protein